MRFIQILFQTPMVKAISIGIKTKTRRTNGLDKINENPDDWQFEWADFSLKRPWRFTQKSSVNPETIKNRTFNQEALKCPYGQIDDVLWVRETWASLVTGGPQNFNLYLYKANPEHQAMTWKPSIHMPRKACRIFLRIINIRVERLNDISEEDAISEGIENILSNLPFENAVWRDYKPRSGFVRHYDRAVDSFKSLWKSINGPGSWDINPWVWVIEFEQVEKPENF